MADAAVSEAFRALSRRRWGPGRPVRLAREVAERAAELPAEERARLVDALASADDNVKGSSDV